MRGAGDQGRQHRRLAARPVDRRQGVTQLAESAGARLAAESIRRRRQVLVSQHRQRRREGFDPAVQVLVALAHPLLQLPSQVGKGPIERAGDLSVPLLDFFYERHPRALRR